MVDSRLLTSGVAKLARANEQLDVFYSELSSALDSTKYPIRGAIQTYAYPKPVGVVDIREWTAYTFYITEVPVFNLGHGLLLGEVLNHFRGAMDHLVWGLVKATGKKSLTAREEREVAFPMARSRANFWSQVNRRLPGVPTKPYRTIIEKYQPYRRSVTGRAMRRLRNLSDIDKHRLIIPTLIFPEDGKVEFKYEGAAFVEFRQDLKFGRQLKEGTKIATHIVAGGLAGQRKVTVEFYITSIPMLTGISSLETALNEISATCSNFLDEIKIHC